MGTTTRARINLLDVYPTPQYLVVAASSNGANTLLAAVPAKKIRVLGYVLTAAGAVNAKFRTAASADLTGLLHFGAAGAMLVAPFSQAGHFETVAGELLDLTLSTNVLVSGHIAYVEV